MVNYIELHDIIVKLTKTNFEIKHNNDILYKCKKCGGDTFKWFFSSKLIYDKCKGVGRLYYFELLKYPEYFNEDDFYV